MKNSSGYDNACFSKRIAGEQKRFRCAIDDMIEKAVKTAMEKTREQCFQIKHFNLWYVPCTETENGSLHLLLPGDSIEGGKIWKENIINGSTPFDHWEARVRDVISRCPLVSTSYRLGK